MCSSDLLELAQLKKEQREAFLAENKVGKENTQSLFDSHGDVVDVDGILQVIPPTLIVDKTNVSLTSKSASLGAPLDSPQEGMDIDTAAPTTPNMTPTKSFPRQRSPPLKHRFDFTGVQAAAAANSAAASAKAKADETDDAMLFHTSHFTKRTSPRLASKTLVKDSSDILNVPPLFTLSSLSDDGESDDDMDAELAEKLLSEMD